MKKVILSVLFVGFAMAANAQYILGGQFGFVSASESYDNLALNYSAPDSKNSTLIFAPTIGYQYNAKLQFGVSINYEVRSFTNYNSIGYIHSSYEGWTKNKQSAFGLAPYVRYNVVSSGKWSVFAQGQLGLMCTPRSYTHNFETIPSVDIELNGTSKAFDFSLTILPGVNYRISDKCSADLYIDLAALTFASTSTSNYNDVTDPDKVTSVVKDRYFGLVANAAAQSLNMHLGNFRLGFNYHF